MTYYRYNALDIAAYIKWTGIPADTERTYLDLLFQMREQILARPLAKDFESFAMAVFREMYHVWARGFENEFSDVNLIAPEGSVALFCDQEFLALESYMKLLSLHLILTENLPYVRINFAGLPLLIGVDGEFSDFEKNLVLAADMLRLSTRDDMGHIFDLSQGVPDEPVCLGLQSDFRSALFGAGGYRVRRNNDYQEKMRILREKSRREQEVREILKSGEDARRDRKNFLTGIPVIYTPPVDHSDPVLLKDDPLAKDNSLSKDNTPAKDNTIILPDLPKIPIPIPGEDTHLMPAQEAAATEKSPSRPLEKTKKKR
jgi:hypothetical protein